MSVYIENSASVPSRQHKQNLVKAHGGGEVRIRPQSGLVESRHVAAATSDSATQLSELSTTRRLGDSGLNRQWPSGMGVHSRVPWGHTAAVLPVIFIFPACHLHYPNLGFVSNAGRCHHFAIWVNIYKLFSACRLQPISDLQAYFTSTWRSEIGSDCCLHCSKPQPGPPCKDCTGTWGCRNNLRENKHSQHCQLWVPALHEHLKPCLLLHFAVLAHTVSFWRIPAFTLCGQL